MATSEQSARSVQPGQSFSQPRPQVSKPPTSPADLFVPPGLDEGICAEQDPEKYKKEVKRELIWQAVDSLSKPLESGEIPLSASFVDANITNAQGLERVSPSIPRLARSDDPPPVSPLEGSVGRLANSLHSTITCFISYDQRDLTFVKRLEIDLQSHDVSCRLDPKYIKEDEIRFRANDKVLIVLSRHSFASTWLSPEVEFILQNQRGERHLFLLQLDDTAREAPKRWWQFIINFSRQDASAYSKALSELLRGLKA